MIQASKTIFEFSSHFDYLHARLTARENPRGTKTRLSAFLRIQPAFLSQVLARKYSLSLEQADLASQFFDHSGEESEFFLLLVSRDRAGTPSLRRHFEQQINAILKKRLQVVERLGRKAEINEETKGVYYSSWLYAAVHVSCTVPRLRTRKAIAAELGLPPGTVGKVLDFLQESRLLRRENDAYLPTESWIRLDKASPHIVKHHANWRQKAIQNLETQTDQDLHYSGVFSLDLATALRVKDRFLDFWKSQMREIETAQEEEIFAVGMDLFRLKR